MGNEAGGSVGGCSIGGCNVRDVVGNISNCIRTSSSVL